MDNYGATIHLFCPRLVQEEWDMVEHQWDKKPFYALPYRSFFGLPTNLARQTKAAVDLLYRRGLLAEVPINFAVNEQTFGGTLLIAINRNVKLHGFTATPSRQTVFRGAEPRTVPNPNPAQRGEWLGAGARVNDLETRAISGKFMSFFFAGKYTERAHWIRHVYRAGRANHLNFHELYIWYATCPVCAKKQGYAQVVIFGKIV